MKTKVQIFFLACIVAATSLQPVFAQTSSSAGKVIWFNAGWSSEVFGLRTTAAIANPAGCASTAQYEASSTDPGFKVYYAAVLTAYTTGSSVVVTVSNTTCFEGAPVIIGIAVSPS